MAELYKKFTSLYPYPHLRIAPGAPSSYIHHLYLNRLADGRTYGFTPVLVVLDDLLLSTIQNNISARTKNPPADINAEYVKSYAQDILTEHQKRLDKDSLEILVRKILARADSTLFENYYEGFLTSQVTVPRGIAPALRAPAHLTFVSSLMNEDEILDNSAEIILLEIPTTSPSDVFAYLPFGGWEDVPSAEDMLALAQYWYERDNAIPAVIAATYLEFYTAEPITTLRDAEVLALEQGIISRALKPTSYEDLSCVVKGLYNKPSWFVWWE